MLADSHAMQAAPMKRGASHCGADKATISTTNARHM